MVAAYTLDKQILDTDCTPVPSPGATGQARLTMHVLGPNESKLYDCSGIPSLSRGRKNKI